MPSITVELPDVPVSELEAAIVQQIAHEMLSWTSYGPDGEEGQVPTKLERELRDYIEKLIKEQAAQYAPNIVEDVLNEGIQQYDTYGSKHGEIKTVRTVIAEEIVRKLSHDSYGRSHDKNFFQQLIKKEVEDVLAKELREAIREAKSAALEVVKAETQKSIAQALEAALPKI